MVADPRQAERLLRQAQSQGAGATRLFARTSNPDKPTVNSLLRNAQFVRDNQAAAGHIDQQVATILRETGLRSADLVRGPVLFGGIDVGQDRLRRYIAYSPGIPNGLSLRAHHFAAPDPHGPVVRGKDLFRQATEQATAPNHLKVHWVENFYWAHLGGGSVHCATNALRDTSGERPWWTTSAPTRPAQ